MTEATKPNLDVLRHFSGHPLKDADLDLVMSTFLTPGQSGMSFRVNDGRYIMRGMLEARMNIERWGNLICYPEVDPHHPGTMLSEYIIMNQADAALTRVTGNDAVYLALIGSPLFLWRFRDAVASHQLPPEKVVILHVTADNALWSLGLTPSGTLSRVDHDGTNQSRNLFPQSRMFIEGMVAP